MYLIEFHVLLRFLNATWFEVYQVARRGWGRDVGVVTPNLYSYYKKGHQSILNMQHGILLILINPFYEIDTV